MTVSPLVVVRVSTVVPVPPVCHALWTAEDWRKTERRVVEPLVLDGPSGTWVATGARNAAGKLLYRRG